MPNVDPQYGERLDNFVRIQSFAADVAYDAGDERYGSEQRFAEQTLIFISRHIDDIRPTDIIEYRAVNYDIERIEELGRRKGLRITATWRAGQ
jgi:head-tail adaptor